MQHFAAFAPTTRPQRPGIFALHSTRRKLLRWDSHTTIKQKTKMINDKQDCIESLTSALKSTSAWRKVTSARFPDDTRNVKAAKILDRLAVDAINLTDTQWLALSAYFGWASQTWRNGLNQTSRQIGFCHRASDLDIFVKILIQNLSASCVAA
jgi:hypothetical protein